MTENLRTHAKQRHTIALRNARFWRVPLVIVPLTPYSRYVIQGACRREAMRLLARAAKARAVFANADRLEAAR